jgi:hypothetical protein
MRQAILGENEAWETETRNSEINIIWLNNLIKAHRQYFLCFKLHIPSLICNIW